MRTRTLCWIYGLIAAGALVATWTQNIRFFLEDDNGGVGGFIEGGFENAAAASLTLDLGFMIIAAFVFMAVEARRLGIRHLWLYYAGSLLIAISVTFPLFLLARELKLAQLEGQSGMTYAPASARISA